LKKKRKYLNKNNRKKLWFSINIFNNIFYYYRINNEQFNNMIEILKLLIKNKFMDYRKFSKII
jgi:hypothetical protein